MSELRQREPRVRNEAFLRYIRTLPCSACGRGPSQAAHIGMANPAIGKRFTGLAEKASDRYATPLCPDCHLNSPMSQHNVGERKFWERVGKDPFEIAASLYIEFEGRKKPPTRV